MSRRYPFVVIASLLAAAALSSASPGVDSAGAAEGSEIPEDQLVILCDPKGRRFSLRLGGPEAPHQSYPDRHVVDPHALVELLPGWNGDLSVRGELVRYVRCGPYTIRVEGDFYNSHTEGENGAVDPFVNVQVLRGPKVAYPENRGKVRFVQCQPGLQSATCESGYATRLDARFEPTRKVLELVETTSVTADIYDEGARRWTLTRKMTFEDDLSLWAAQ